MNKQEMKITSLKLPSTTPLFNPSMKELTPSKVKKPVIAYSKDIP